MFRSFFALVCLVLGVPADSKSQSCIDVLLSPSLFIGNCTDDWTDVRKITLPTQSDVGWAWIARKLTKNFGNEQDAQDEIDSSPIPVVLGPSSSSSSSVAFYIVDDHHTLSALDYTGFSGIAVTMVVMCDWRSKSLTQFWADMAATYDYILKRNPYDLNALPQAISPETDLPKSFEFTPDSSSFGDDPFRSLAGYSRKTTADSCPSKSDNCNRCFYRGCQDDGTGILFFEFMWAYFFNFALVVDQTWWPSSSQFSDFAAAWAALPVATLKNIEDIDVDEWQAVADLVLPLCRGDATGSYELPQEYFNEMYLPGYTEGDEQLPDDPDCSIGMCASSN